jgi:uncharacterized protein YbjT (DUF2867 family)
VKQVIFLSSLQAPEAGAVRSSARPPADRDSCANPAFPVTELRAGIIVGAGSAAFEVMRDMVYNLPVLTPPRWVVRAPRRLRWKTCCIIWWQLLDHPAEQHRVLEAAGPEVLSYQQQFNISWRVSGKHRLADPHPPDPLDFGVVSECHHLGAADDRQSADPGAKARSDGRRSRPARADPQDLIRFDDAVRNTLKEEEQLVNSSDWGYDAQAFARWRPEYGYYPKQAGCTVKTPPALPRCGRW